MRVANAEKTIQDYIAQYNMASFLNPHVLECLQLFHFPAYSYVYVEEEEQHFLYFLVEGQVQCNHYHLNGKLAVFALCDPFAAIGDLEILTKERVQSNVIATRDTFLLGVESSVVHYYSADDPKFLRFIIEQLREKLYKANSLQINHLLPVTARLALYLLAQSPNVQGEISMPEKEHLASMLGTTTRHLNRVLKELVEVGCISASYPMVRILDRGALQEIAIQPD